MLGAIIGDIIGSWYEQNGTKDWDFPLFVDLSRVTDDSILSVATAETITRYGERAEIGQYAKELRKWGRRYPEAGYGGSFIKWLSDPAMGPYNSWGNGSAMRVSPVGWAFKDETSVLAQAAFSASPTHNHPEGIKGAQAVALSIYMARQGASKEEIRDELSQRFDYDLARSIEDIRPDYRFEISCQKSVPESIIAFLDSVDFESAIRNAISLGGDADTQAAIAGSIAEAFYGSIPEKFLAFALPRLPMDVLTAAMNFAEKYLPESTGSVLEEELSLRIKNEDNGFYGHHPRYRILLSGETKKRIDAYRDDVNHKEIEPGERLKNVISQWPVSRLSSDIIIRALLESKEPCIFAESALKGDGSDWNTAELSILGDMSIHMPVTIYDNGLHRHPARHQPPIQGNLIYVPGALLRNGQGLRPADWDVVDENGIDPDIDIEAYYRLYECRILPGLQYAGTLAESRGRKALVTMPGLGCGAFAGDFRGKLQLLFRDVLEKILENHQAELHGIAALWYDPYQGCPPSRRKIGTVDFMVRPLGENGTVIPQLCSPDTYSEEGDDFSNCELFSFVAWDHVSWPGNDFWLGSRSTDDGVKAAATDTMFRMTGVRGRYNPKSSTYDPPEGYRCWYQVVRKNGMTIRGWGNVLSVDTGSTGRQRGIVIE